MTNIPTFAIVGGGIGGLTLAIALQRKGYQVKVYENTATIKPLGAGLGLAANAVKALSGIGVSEDVVSKGKIIRKLLIKDQRGKLLSETDSEKISNQFGMINSFTIHRADLHDVLFDKVHPGTVQLAKQCIDFKQHKNGVTLFFQDGSSDHAEYVIACDGIHSVFRKKLLPGSEPRYAGYTCWRGVIDHAPADFNYDEVVEFWGAGARFGVVPLTRKRVYWFACLNAHANDQKKRAYQIEQLLQHFGEFPDPVAKILMRTENEQLIWNDIIDLAPIEKFAFGNIVLLGDAAHATTPNMGQGACMAIEDAAVLSNCLDEYNEPEEAFLKFQEQRIARTTKIVNHSWLLGRVAQVEHPLLVGLRNTAIRFTPKVVTEKQFKFLYDIDF